MNDCCGPTVDSSYLCALLNGLTLDTLIIGHKIPVVDATGVCGYATNFLQQTRLRFIANQAMVSGTPLSFSWTQEDIDSLGLITTPGTTMTIPLGADGFYTIEFGFTLSAAPTNAQQNVAQVVIAGSAASTKNIARTYKASSPLLADQHIVVGPLPLASGDTIVCQGLQTIGTPNANPGYCMVTRNGSL